VNRKYMATGPEAEFQPGSRGRVLRNRLGITRVRDMNEAESQALLIAQEAAISTVSGSVPSTNGQATTAA
jgi:cell filamentation protein